MGTRNCHAAPSNVDKKKVCGWQLLKMSQRQVRARSPCRGAFSCYPFKHDSTGWKGRWGRSRARMCVARYATTDVNPLGGWSARSGRTRVLNPFHESEPRLIVYRQGGWGGNWILTFPGVHFNLIVNIFSLRRQKNTMAQCQRFISKCPPRARHRTLIASSCSLWIIHVPSAPLHPTFWLQVGLLPAAVPCWTPSWRRNGCFSNDTRLHSKHITNQFLPVLFFAFFFTLVTDCQHN